MRDPDQIEREIADERAALAESLKALDHRLSPEALVNRATDALREPGGALAHLAKDNPMALALIGTGVAWMMANGRTSKGGELPPARPVNGLGATEPPPPAPAPVPKAPAAAYDPTRTPTSPGLRSDTPPMSGIDERIARADRAIRAAETEGVNSMSTNADPFTYDDATRSERVGDRARRYADGARVRAKQSAASLRARLHDGLDSLPENARARILSARLSAIEAQAAVEARISRGADSARRTAQQNPLLIGAVAFGIGAALAAALPRTSTENRAVGARRDQLFDEAERVFREESAKLRSVAEAAVAEGREAVKDTLRSGPPSEDDPAERVHEAARKEADRQEVGKSAKKAAERHNVG